MSVFSTAFTAFGSVLAGKFIGKGLETAYKSYVEGTKIDSFLDTIGIGATEVGAIGESGTTAVAEALTTKMSDLPQVDLARVATSGGNTAGTFSAGKVANVPLGSSNRVPNAIGRANVQKSIISRVQTVGIPRPQTAAPTIKLGSSQVTKVRRAKA